MNESRFLIANISAYNVTQFCAQHDNRELRITQHNSTVCVGCGHRSSQLWAVSTRNMIYLPSGGRREELCHRLRILELVGATSRSFLRGQYLLSILWTVVHGYHSVTFQEAWNVCWIAWFVRHHITILTDFWLYEMHTHTHTYIYISFNNLQLDS